MLRNARQAALLAAMWITSILMISCGADDERPRLPAGFDDASLVDLAAKGKPDSLTRWLTEIKGSIGFNTATKGQTSYKEWFHGYTFALNAGDEVAVKAYGSYYGLVRIYGPRKSSGSWGNVRASDWISAVSPEQVYRGAIDSFKATTAGTYLLVVGSPWDASYDYDMVLGCPAGQCGCDPKTEWWRKYVATDPLKCQVLKFYCQPYTLYFSNDCGCGCEQDKTCQQIYDCEPPTDCSSLQAKCPYSTFGL